MYPISNREAYNILKKIENNNDFFKNIVIYLENILQFEYPIPISELRKNKKLSSDLLKLVIFSNTGDISILDDESQDIIKNIVNY